MIQMIDYKPFSLFFYLDTFVFHLQALNYFLKLLSRFYGFSFEQFGFEHFQDFEVLHFFAIYICQAVPFSSFFNTLIL